MINYVHKQHQRTRTNNDNNTSNNNTVTEGSRRTMREYNAGGREEQATGGVTRTSSLPLGSSELRRGQKRNLGTTLHCAIHNLPRLAQPAGSWEAVSEKMAKE